MISYKGGNVLNDWQKILNLCQFYCKYGCIAFKLVKCT